MAQGLGAAAAWAAGDPHAGLVGVWQTEDKSQITISACSDDYCGNLTKIVVPKDEYDKLTPAEKQAVDAMDPSQFPDARNKDASLRTRTLLGMQLFSLHPSDKPTIFNGTMYNPQDGNTYNGYIEVLGPSKIRLNGCVLYNIVCRGQDWTRVPQPAADATGAAAAPAAAAQPAAAAPATGSFQ
jgi:uncharacterized protein (DUF2147 family)